MAKDVAWSRLRSVGARWVLLGFDEQGAPTWEDYWQEQREYWGADLPDKGRVQHYFGVTQTEEKLLEKSRKEFLEYVAYLKLWNGLCSVGDSVHVITQQPNVIVLSKEWNGVIKDHSDLEIWLKEERTVYFRHVRYYAEIYSFGTRVISSGSIEAQRGEKPGTTRVSHRQGRTRDKNETVALDSANGSIRIGDAEFKVQ